MHGPTFSTLLVYPPSKKWSSTGTTTRVKFLLVALKVLLAWPVIGAVTPIFLHHYHGRVGG